MTAIELVAFRQPSILAQEIGKRAAIEPLAVQPPFAARSQQPIAASTNSTWSQRVPLRLTPSRSAQNRSRPSSRHSSSASQQAPHCRGRRRRTCDSFSWTIEPSGTSPSQRSSGNSDSVRGCVVPASITSIERRHASSWLELISPRYKTWRCTTRPRPTRRFSTTLQLRCSLPSFRLMCERRNMMAAQYPHDGGAGDRLGRHYSRFRRFGPSYALVLPCSDPRKFGKPGSNRRSQARRLEIHTAHAIGGHGWRALLRLLGDHHFGGDE